MNMSVFSSILKKVCSASCLWQAALALGCFLSLLPLDVEGARRRPSFEEDYTILLREVMDNLDALKNEVQIQESQISTFEEKFKNLEEIIDSLRQESATALQAVKESLKYHSTTLDAKLSDQHNSAKGLSQEVKSLANDNQQMLNDCKKRLAELEKSLDLQNRNIENLQSALTLVIEAVKGKEASAERADPASSDPATKTYRVKAGDSLEKIAKQHQTTIKKLKEANNLTGDQILAGQKLKIPE